jgi:hypothetical protein
VCGRRYCGRRNGSFSEALQEGEAFVGWESDEKSNALLFGELLVRMQLSKGGRGGGCGE